MDPQLVQRTRYVLRSRVRRTQTCPLPLFPAACEHLVDWLTHHPIFSALVTELERQAGDAGKGIVSVIGDCTNGEDQDSRSLGSYNARTTVEHAAICWLMVKAVAMVVGKNESQRLLRGERLEQ